MEQKERHSRSSHKSLEFPLGSLAMMFILGIIFAHSVTCLGNFSEKAFLVACKEFFLVVSVFFHCTDVKPEPPPPFSLLSIQAERSP